MNAEKRNHTILVGEDELEVRGYLEMALECLGYSVTSAQDGEEILTALRTAADKISAVLLDLVMPQMDGIQVLKDIRQSYPDLPVIVVSGAASTLNVVAAMKAGATDFLSKPVTHEELSLALEKALEEGVPAGPEPAAPAAAGESRMFIGSTLRMREIQSMVSKVGWSEAPVLIQGETGSGKEVLARELHRNSPRAGKIFLKLNCAALPSELVESELFGYERGAFTGAFQRKAGMFETADGGTILLDEIGDMDVRLQAKLLQVLQDREFQRIGGKDTIKVDVRIMAATHRDLESAIAARTFREDLYYRLNVFNVVLPPLRERKDDIISIAECLLQKYAIPGRPVALTSGLRHAMTTYHWPGNVRELENTMRKLIVLRNPDTLARELHAKATRKQLAAASAPAAPPVQRAETPILEQMTQANRQAEAETILAALNSTRWNRKQAAALLKIDYKAFLYKMKKLGVEDDGEGIAPGAMDRPEAMGASGS